MTRLMQLVPPLMTALLFFYLDGIRVREVVSLGRLSHPISRDARGEGAGAAALALGLSKPKRRATTWALPRSTPASRRTKKKRTRSRGRPPAGSGEQLSRESIIAATLELAKTTPLHELSIVQVARALGIAPGLIHYYLGDRDHLLSGVMNAFYRIVVGEWPATKNDWRRDVEAAGRHLYMKHVEYAGIATYAAAHNRFRMAQLVEPGETDFGLLLFERFTGSVRAVGLSARTTAMYAQLLVDFFVMSAHSTVRRRWPGEHGGFIQDVFSRLDPATYPNATFVRREFVRVDAGTAFDAGLALVMAGVDAERRRALAKKR